MTTVYDGLPPLPKDMGIDALIRLANLRHAEARQADREIDVRMARAIAQRKHQQSLQRQREERG